MKVRVLASLTSGDMASDLWLQALAQEPPVRGKAIGCADCPLRPGGEWEEGARRTAPLATMAGRWGCHDADRPCAGMIRLAAEVDHA